MESPLMFYLIHVSKQSLKKHNPTRRTPVEFENEVAHFFLNWEELLIVKLEGKS